MDGLLDDDSQRFTLVAARRRSLLKKEMDLDEEGGSTAPRVCLSFARAHQSSFAWILPGVRSRRAAVDVARVRELASVVLALQRGRGDACFFVEDEAMQDLGRVL